MRHRSAHPVRPAFGRDRNRPPVPETPRLQLQRSDTFGPQAIQPARILLVEDEALHRRMLRVVLSEPRLWICEVESGEAAIDLLAFKTFDLVLLDVVLPRMSGLETLTWLRRGPAQWRDTPVMALVAARDEPWVGPMKAAGLDDWVAKPVDRMDILSRIARILPSLSDSGA